MPKITYLTKRTKCFFPQDDYNFLFSQIHTKPKKQPKKK